MKITIELDGDDTKSVIYALEFVVNHYKQQMGRKDILPSDLTVAAGIVVRTERLTGAFETALRAEQGAQQP